MSGETLQGPVIPFETVGIFEFDQTTGDILRVFDLPMHSAAALIGEPGYLLGNPDPATQYVRDGVLVDKAPGAPVVKGKTISGLPLPTRAVILLQLPDGTALWQGQYAVDDGEIEISFAQAGSYVVRLSAAPWLTTDVQLVQE